MKSSTALQFSKQLDCPSAVLLVSFNRRELAPETDVAVKLHLDTCDFCACERPLLTFYTKPRAGECRVPELPKNLRVLAESILGQGQAVKVVG